VKWGNYVQKRLEALDLPGDMTKRQAQPHVKALAADIAELGEEPIHAPVFRDETGKIISGRDRMAALLLNGAKRCWIRWASCTDEEAQDLEASENLYRRNDDRAALIAKRVGQVADSIAAAITQPGTLSHVTNSVKAIARKRVAKEAGITPAAVRKAEQREAAKSSKKNAIDVPSPGRAGGDPTTEAARGGEAAITPEPPDMIAMHGVSAPAAWLAEVANTVVALGEADKLLRQAQAAVKRIKDGNYPGAVYQRLYAHIHAAAADVRYATPVAVCVYCRDPGGGAGRRAECNGCGKTGFLLAEQLTCVPRELLEPDAKPVTRAASAVAVQKARLQQVPRSKATLRIQDDAGNPIVVSKYDPATGDLFGDEPVDDAEVEA
jgi:hypothetical protein